MPTTTPDAREATVYETRRDAEILRIAAAISVTVTIIYALTGIIGGDRGFLFRSIGPAIVGAFALWQLARSRSRADWLLVVAAAFIAVQVRLIEQPHIEMAARIGLLMIGAAGSVVVRGRRMWFLIGYSLLIVATQLWWFDEAADTESLVVNSVVAVMAFLFISWLIMWVRASRETEEARYTLLFDRLPVPIFEEDYTAVGEWLASLRRDGVTDLDGYLSEHPEALRSAAGKIVVHNANPAAVQLLEAERTAQLLGPLDPVAVTHDTLRSLKDQLLAIWEDRDHLDAVLQGATLKGSPVDGLLRWVVPREGGRLDLANVVISIVDVTDLRRAEHRLRDLVRSKDEFIASVSHELRTPLTAVVGLTGELRYHLETFLPSERREFIELIADQATDVANIVEDLLVAARADIGTVTVAATHVDVAEAVRTVVDMTSNGARPHVELPTEGELVAVADGARVRQILRNLLTNAERYGGSKVTVRAGSDERQAWIEVLDNGPGIDRAEQERIFEPYATAHQVSGVTAAVGLGLTVSRQLAQLMGGDLTYRHENGESAFRLSLPAAD